VVKLLLFGALLPCTLPAPAVNEVVVSFSGNDTRAAMVGVGPL
jgi:hypothetical protein